MTNTAPVTPDLDGGDDLLNADPDLGVEESLDSPDSLEDLFSALADGGFDGEDDSLDPEPVEPVVEPDANTEISDTTLEPEPAVVTPETPVVDEVVATPEPAPEPVVEETIDTSDTPPQASDEELQQIQQQWVEGLEQTYAIPEDLVDELRVNPQNVLPKIAAVIHDNVMKQVYGGVLQQVQNMLPEFITSVVSQNTQTQTSTNEFYDAFDELRPHHKLVNQVSKLYMAENPNANLQDFIRDVGTMAWLRSGLPRADLMAKLQDPGETVVTTPVVTTPPGLTPVNSGNRQPNLTTEPVNPFTEMAMSGIDDL